MKEKQKKMKMVWLRRVYLVLSDVFGARKLPRGLYAYTREAGEHIINHPQVYTRCALFDLALVLI